MTGNIFYIFLWLIIGVSSGFSEVNFSGDQDGLIEEGEYLATGPITVKAGKTLTFEPGCIIRFQQYAGLTVYGTLKCAGTVAKPIVFTSKNQRASIGNKGKAPAPFDWNGITVADSAASIDFEYVRVAYGTSGIDVKSSASNVTLKQVVFIENGRAGLTVNNKEIEVNDNQPFSFVQPQLPVQNFNDTAEAGAVKSLSMPGKKIEWKLATRIGLGAVAVAGAAISGYYYNRAVDYQDKFVNGNTTAEVDSYQHRRNDARKYSTIGSIVSVLGCAGFAVTFCF